MKYDTFFFQRSSTQGVLLRGENYIQADARVQCLPWSTTNKKNTSFIFQ